VDALPASPRVRTRFHAHFGRAVVPSEAQRVERFLAAGRVFLAASSILAISLDPTQPSRYATLAFGLLAAYAVHSLVTLALVRIRRESTPPFRFTVHAIDVLWPALIGFFTEGPNSPFFVLFTFVLLSAAYRWGFLETMATAAATVVLLFLEALVVSPGLAHVLEGQYTSHQLIMRAMYLLIVGYLLGFLGEEEKRLQAETAAIARTIARAQAETGVLGALRAVFDEILYFFGARAALLSVREVSTGRAFLWEARRDDPGQELNLVLSELDPARREQYSFDVPGEVWHVFRGARARPDALFDLFALDEEGTRRKDAAWTPPETFLTARGFRSLLGAAINLGNEWSGCLLIFEPDLAPTRDGAAHFLQTLCHQVTPAIYSIYLTRRLRSRAGAVERARVARELHDGVIQALIGLEMQVDVLRRQATASPHHLAQELSRVQGLLHQEVVNLRELMQQMRPVDVTPKQFLDFLASTVDRFRRDTGISARFVTPLQEVSLLPRVCNELARVVQEALVNVRKHSGAHNVLVRFDAQDGYWMLVVDDDGHGFDFSGRLTQAELEAERKGPMIIKERVRSIGGELAVESTPGRGARLEIRIPQKGYG